MRRMRDDASAMVKQEIYCHECGNYVQFELDMSKEGNHLLECPNCGHEHCRVVRRGRITDDRWASRNGNTYGVTAQSYSAYTNTTWTSSASTSANFIYYGVSGTCTYA